MKTDDIQKKLIAAKQVINNPRLRTLSGKRRTLVEVGNVYGERIDEQELRSFMEQAYADEAARKMLLNTLDESAMSVKTLSEVTGLSPDIVFKHLLVLQQRGEVEVGGVDGNWPLYRCI
jgi:predicted Rossmann fold nucleotide-binding protein DprA/Smf involved in DNA uptake